MKIQLLQEEITKSSADTLIVTVWEGGQLDGATQQIDQALNGAISELIELGDLTGKKGEVRLIYPREQLNAKRVIVVGLGKVEKIDLLTIRNAAAHAITTAHQYKSMEVATSIYGLDNFAPAQAAQAIVEGSLLAVHQYKKSDEVGHEISLISLIEQDGEKSAEIAEGIRFAEAIVSGVKLARDLTFTPPNIAKPIYIADLVRELSKKHQIEVMVGGRQWIEQQKMGAFLAVAQGAANKPKFIVMEHYGTDQDVPAIVLVGKGITFDTGGLSIKPTSNMVLMKADMAGGAAVIGTMVAVAQLKLPINLVGIIPCAENSVDAESFRPSDVITASNGKTIEVVNTDAEGRLILADALVYAKNHNPAFVIDIATLTGIARRALGEGVASALFCNDDRYRDQLLAAGQRSNELLWPFPLWDVYRKDIESPSADLKNAGSELGGLGTSAVFLEAFTDYPWAHIDMAPMSLANKARGHAYERHGATGYGVRLLVEFLRSWQA